MVATYVQTLRLFERDLRIFLASSGLASLAWGGVRVVILNLYLLRLGYGPEFVGMFSAAGALAFALFCPVAGALGTHWCSRSMVIVGASLLATGFLLLSMAEFLVGPWRTVWLLATVILAQMGGSLYMVNGLPFISSGAR